MAKAKLNPATQAVEDARRLYPDYLQSVVTSFGPLPYMQKPIDPRTADKRLIRMTPDQMVQLAQTNPAQAEKAAQRIHELEQKAPPEIAGQDVYEP